MVGTTTLNDGLWHHVVGVRADKTGRMYVDGVEENNDTNPLVVGVNIICYYAHIGGGNFGPDNCYEEFAEQYFFTGQIDEVALFRRALTRRRSSGYLRRRIVGHVRVNAYTYA